MNSKLIIFISGRGSNMQRIIEESQKGILKDVAEVILVFSDQPEAPGLKTAEAMEIETQNIPAKGKSRNEFNEQVMKLLEEQDFDYLILAGYMRILPAEIVRKYPKKIINIHPADTQLHQGLNGYKWAYENKLKSTKITVHYVDEGLDTGEIIAQREVDLTGVKSLEEVEQRGLAVEHEMYTETLLKLLSNIKENHKEHKEDTKDTIK